MLNYFKKVSSVSNALNFEINREKYLPIDYCLEIDFLIFQTSQKHSDLIPQCNCNLIPMRKDSLSLQINSFECVSIC